MAHDQPPVGLHAASNSKPMMAETITSILTVNVIGLLNTLPIFVVSNKEFLAKGRRQQSLRINTNQTHAISSCSEIVYRIKV
ncbi:MAG: hypothetical protein FJ077_05975 [Cyanobacteria bacterium K_DeepCast_35m_m2_023]|nr:hypothetical protein [Cyanobacteria bacterium K_DeepCast_35m_m2_023]